LLSSTEKIKEYKISEKMDPGRIFGSNKQEAEVFGEHYV
jgi:hypothetical protein